jgi:hypothetical protein
VREPIDQAKATKMLVFQLLFQHAATRG